MVSEKVLPGETEVDRRGWVFSVRTVHRVRIHLGDECYTLEDPGRGPLRATRTRVVRGIALKTEPVEVEEWLSALGQALEERVRTDAGARAALSRFLG